MKAVLLSCPHLQQHLKQSLNSLIFLCSLSLCPELLSWVTLLRAFFPVWFPHLEHAWNQVATPKPQLHMSRCERHLSSLPRGRKTQKQTCREEGNKKEAGKGTGTMYINAGIRSWEKAQLMLLLESGLVNVLV